VIISKIEEEKELNFLSNIIRIELNDDYEMRVAEKTNTDQRSQ
jgi:hypothetical protein